MENIQLTEENTIVYEELSRLQEENKNLTEKLHKTQFGVQFLKEHSNAKENFLFYTGVPSAAEFDIIVDLVKEYVPVRKNIDIPNQVLLTLMKLKQNLRHKDLAIRFEITERLVSTIIGCCLPILSACLEFLINWPDKETCKKHLPSAFKSSYPNTRVTIDCTEIFIERPSNLTARAQSYSNYKHHNTMKILVGITPSGSISYISKCWGGRASDKHITQEDDFLAHLEYGDQVLADRGFLIDEEVANCGAELIIPSFTKGKKQLSQREVEISRKIARVRIHVERAIRRLKHFSILGDIFPIALMQHADDIVTICAAITNLQGPLIKE